MKQTQGVLKVMLMSDVNKNVWNSIEIENKKA